MEVIDGLLYVRHFTILYIVQDIEFLCIARISTDSYIVSIDYSSMEWFEQYYYCEKPKNLNVIRKIKTR